MFGFLKKKKKDADPPPKTGKAEGQPKKTSAAPPKKKRFSLKFILVILGVFIAAGASAFAVYTLWFAPKTGKDGAPLYQKTELPHVGLPEEMLEFSFYHFPDLYRAMTAYNLEINLFDREIARIEQISRTYPDQVKITEKEKKIWEKAKETLKKAFIKIEKPVKETYVLFRVNEAQGLIRIRELNKELTEAAQSALAPAQALTQKLKQEEEAPEGLVKGSIYKLKKKFL